jgi:hypothetical protein
MLFVGSVAIVAMLRLSKEKGRDHCGPGQNHVSRQPVVGIVTGAWTPGAT